MSSAAIAARFFAFLVEFMPTIVEAFYQKNPELRERPAPPPAGESDAEAARRAILDAGTYDED